MMNSYAITFLGFIALALCLALPQLRMIRQELEKIEKNNFYFFHTFLNMPISTLAIWRCLLWN